MVSVIVPVYNVEQYLRACIDSIVCQTYRDLEIILVDDGSTDKCPEICEEYAKKDPRIIVIHKQNGGLSDARNTGIEISKGEYLTFVDGDDKVLPDMVSYLYSLIAESGGQVSTCNRKEYYYSKEQFKISKTEKIEDYVINGNIECMSALLKGEIDVTAWGKMYHTSLFANVRYPKDRFNEDVFTTYKIISQCDKVAIGCKQKYVYVIREGSIMTSKFNIKHLDGIYGKEEQMRFVIENYPSLIKYAKCDLISACNNVVYHIGKTSSDTNKKVVSFLQQYYRKYIGACFCGNLSVGSKLFAVACFVSVYFMIRLVRYIPFNVK